MVLVNQTSAMSSSSSARSSNVNVVGILQDDNVEEIYLEVSVINPITRKEGDGELVTTYAIYIETNDSAFTMSRSMVRRRYSEFVVLRSILQEQHPSLTVPRLPGRTLLGKRFDQRFIQERCSGLQSFLKAIVEQPVYLSNKSLHLFLQTSLTMEQIQNVVNGCESFELPHNNSSPFVLYPVDSKTPSQGGRVGILKREACSSLASCPEHECQAQGKHQHMRVGSGIVVCPYASVDQAGTPTVRTMAGSAPFNIPAGSPKPLAVSALRSCASDTCLDGTATGTSSLAGSKKRVSFFIENKNRQSLLRRCDGNHKDTGTEARTAAGRPQSEQQPCQNGKSWTPAISILTEQSRQDSDIRQDHNRPDYGRTALDNEPKDEPVVTSDSEETENNNALSDTTLKVVASDACSDNSNCETCIQIVATGVMENVTGVADIALDVAPASVTVQNIVG
ncbi:uncharacterized protein LOC111268958 isoform X2 [Varroa jacobsoni]|uniref:PX domain-containing protein n=1 Tax=Varroa destructor TaxID=109461 RepID=A0A7M7KRD2_VARDE|nr:uncharacterized protein LOC111254224 isoform X3 [Varroa destructor]XP_022703962.1 uncharacterized protein LOC111268958 isoform X2 [Varroa jacobsoni]